MPGEDRMDRPSEEQRMTADAGDPRSEEVCERVSAASRSTRQLTSTAPRTTKEHHAMARESAEATIGLSRRLGSVHGATRISTSANRHSRYPSCQLIRTHHAHKSVILINANTAHSNIGAVACNARHSTRPAQNLRHTRRRHRQQRSHHAQNI